MGCQGNRAVLGTVHFGSTFVNRVDVLDLETRWYFAISKGCGPYHVDGLEEAVFAVLVDSGWYVIFTGTSIDVHFINSLADVFFSVINV